MVFTQNHPTAKMVTGSYHSSISFSKLSINFFLKLQVILDRQVDLATPLHHTWTYQALAHDVLQYSLNRVSITEGDQGKMLC